MVTWPVESVVFCGPANWLYGIGTAKTLAPWTGRPLQAVTVKCSWILCVPSVTSRGVIDAFETFRGAGIARSAPGIVPGPDGQPLAVVVDDGTAAVCFDTNTVEPEPFVAV